MRRFYFLVFVLLFASCTSPEMVPPKLISTSEIQSTNKQDGGGVAYSGQRLQEGSTYQCTSDQVISAGIRRDMVNGKVMDASDNSKQQNVTTWRITLNGSKAAVIAFSGATQSLEAPEEFSVYHNSPIGILLTGVWKRGAALTVQTITIDFSNSSFLYSGQDLSPFMNKTNCFVGTCRSIY
jgi:hypothetical protein